MCHGARRSLHSPVHSTVVDVPYALVTTTIRLPFDAIRRPFDCRSIAYLFRPQCSSPRTGRPINSRLTIDYDHSLMTPGKRTCEFNNNKLCAWRHNMPPSLSSPAGALASRDAEQTQRSSTFPRRIRSHADRCVKAALSKAAW